MITISLCMIVKNEEDVLARCLASVTDVVDEIIIVDTGSIDQTKKIAAEFTDKIYDFEWVNDFSAARNFAFSKATMQYQMWLDADDVMEPDEIEKFKLLKQTLDATVDIVTFKYHTHFDETGKPILTSTRERLFKRAKNYQWQDAIHEYILMSGHIINAEIAISHKKISSSGDRNLQIYRGLVAAGKKLSPRETYYFARELMDHGIHAESVEYFERFLNDGQGWFEDNIATCFNLSRLYGFLNEKEKILPILFKSFGYDTPRAEICCQIAYYFKNVKDYKKAIYWFELALTLVKDSIGFVLNDYWDYIPAIELCTCYSSIGNQQKSFDYHLLSKQFKPDSTSVAYNEKYFKSIGMTEQCEVESHEA